MLADTTSRFQLDDWLVEPQLNRLTRDGREVAVENKTMEVLVLLASQPGVVFSNDEIIDAVWGGRPMGESPVYKCIANLRKVLGDDPKSPRYLETISRKGYRLLAEVSTADRREPPARPQARRAPMYWVAIVILIAVLAVTIRYWSTSPDTKVENQLAARSILVMPFENLSGDVDGEYLCRGIAEELLNRLAEIPGLRVIARYSAFSMGSETDDIQAFMKRLEVGYVLRGSVRQHDNRIRVTARLTDLDEAIIWGDSYDRDGDDIFLTQDEIAKTVIKGLALDVGESFASNRLPTQSFDAYRAYLLGKELYSRRRDGWLNDARATFNEAIRLDPEYADPYAGLAAVEAVASMGDRSRVAYAMAAVETALSIDPNNAEALAAQGLLQKEEGSTESYRASVESLRRAIEMNPSLINARNWLSTALMVLGEKEEAWQALEEALALDPLNPILNANYGVRLHSDGRLDEAREHYLRMLELPGVQPYVYDSAANVELSAGRYDGALALVKRGVDAGALELDQHRWFATVVAQYYSRIGLFDQANAWHSAQSLPARSDWRLGAYYELLTRQGRTDRLRQHVDEYFAALGPDTELTLWGRSLIGKVALHNGDYETTIRYLGPLFEEGWSLQNAPGGGTALINTLQHLVVAYQRAGDDDEADRLLSDAIEKQMVMRSNQSRLVSDLVVDEAVTYLLLGDRALALVRFEEAIEAGWRDYYEASTNPRWEGLRGDAAFEALMAGVKQDLDVQRERVLAEERIKPFVTP